MNEKKESKYFKNLLFLLFFLLNIANIFADYTPTDLITDIRDTTSFTYNFHTSFPQAAIENDQDISFLFDGSYSVGSDKLLNELELFPEGYFRFGIFNKNLLFSGFSASILNQASTDYSDGTLFAALSGSISLQNFIITTGIAFQETEYYRGGLHFGLDRLFDNYENDILNYSYWRTNDSASFFGGISLFSGISYHKNNFDAGLNFRGPNKNGDITYFRSFLSYSFEKIKIVIFGDLANQNSYYDPYSIVCKFSYIDSLILLGKEIQYCVGTKFTYSDTLQEEHYFLLQEIRPADVFLSLKHNLFRNSIGELRINANSRGFQERTFYSHYYIGIPDLDFKIGLYFGYNSEYYTDSAVREDTVIDGFGLHFSYNNLDFKGELEINN